MLGEIDCKAPGMQLLRKIAMDRLRSWLIYKFLHVKIDWNQSSYRLSNEPLQQEKGWIFVTEKDRQELFTLNRLGKFLTPKSTEEVLKVTALTRSAAKRRREPIVSGSSSPANPDRAYQARTRRRGLDPPTKDAFDRGSDGVECGRGDDDCFNRAWL